MTRPSIALAQPGVVERFRAEPLRSARFRSERTPRAEPARTPARPPQPATLERLLLPAGATLIVVRLESVDWIEGAGNYVEVHAGAATHRYRHSLGRLEPLLDPRKFARIHRSAIVNLDRIAELRATASGSYDLVMADGAILKLSRGYRRRVFAALGRA